MQPLCISKVKMAVYRLNSDAARANTYDQISRTIKDLPYFVVTPTKRPDIRKKSPFIAESFKDGQRIFFAGLIQVSRNVFMSDHQGNLLAFKKIENGYHLFVWPKILPRTVRERRAIINEFFSIKNLYQQG